MGIAVVTVAAGGLPVVDVTATTPKLGLPVTEAVNGRGLPVTKVTLPRGGLPVTFVGGGTAAWSPADLGAALKGWWKADAQVYSDAGSTLATNGQEVLQWNDHSGNGFHFSPSNATTGGGNGPLFTTGVQNGLPGLVFTAASFHCLANLTFALGVGAIASIFMVVKHNSPAANARVISFKASGQTNDYSNLSSFSLMSASSTSMSVYCTSFRGTGTVVNNTFAQVGTIFNGTNNIVYVNNVAGASSAVVPTFTATGELMVGALKDGDTIVDANNITMLEIIFTNTVLSAGDRTSLANYFTSRWAV